MQAINEKSLLVLAVAAGLAGTAGPAEAQESDAMSGVLEEVIVTAQKREESIMEVPISITALGEEELNVYASAGADIRFLRGRVPSLNIESSFGRLFPRFYIRGWGNTDFDINASQPVSLVYDDVVQENPILKGFPIFDTERIEVLRGPQGTLFGRNTTAGVVNIRSARPTEEVDGYAVLQYLENDELNFEGAIGGGFADGWSTRLSVKYMDRSDWVDNDFTGEADALGGHEEVAARWQVMFETDTFNGLFNVHYRDLSGTARLFRANIIRQGSEGNLIDGFDIDSIELDGRNSQDMEQWGSVLRLEWDFGRTTLTSITGYETFDSFSVGDIDGGTGGIFEVGTSSPGAIPFAAETGDGVSDHDQFTQEFRWTSNDWGRLDWTAGFYYFDESIDIFTENYNTNFGGDVNGEVFQTQDTTAWAFFGSIDYDIAEDLFAKVGLRYSNDDKDYVAERTLSPLSFLGVGPLGPIAVSADDDRWTYDLSITRDFSDQTSAYVRYARGFRAPSIQGRILFDDVVSVADSEIADSFELGIKTDFADGRGRVAGNIFWYTVDDAQLTAVGGMNNINQILNADEVRGQGFEMDFDFLITDNFLFSGAISYNDTEIRDPNLSVAPCGQPLPASSCTVVSPPDPNVDGAVLVNGNPLPQAPEWIYNLNARWNTNVGNGEFYIFADYFFRSGVNFFLYDAVEYRGQELWELGLRAGYIFGDGRYEAALFGRNITDEQVIVGAIDFNNLTGFVNEPRRWGGEFRINFF